MMLTLVASGFAVFFQGVIAVVEMFLWMHPKVYSRLLFEEDDARKVAPIVRNAGLYNAFLAAGLIWGIAELRAGHGDVLAFFLACVAIAGVFGAITLKTSSPFPLTLLIQTLPAVLGLAGLCGQFGLI
jgi:putative membrane protein